MNDYSVVPTQDIRELVQIVASKIYPLETTTNSTFSKQINIGNKIPFVGMKHAERIRQIAIEICKLYIEDTYKPYFSGILQVGIFDRLVDDFTTCDVPHIKNLTVMLSELSCTEPIFYKV